MTFTDEQPKDGDTVMHCGHLTQWSQRAWHWFQFPESVNFTRPDGSTGTAGWFMACEPCLHKHGANAFQFARGDVQWLGNEPVIVETEKS